MPLRPSVLATIFVLFVAPARAEDDLLRRPTAPTTPADTAAEADPFTGRRPHDPGVDKAKSLQTQADQLRLRAAVLGERAEELWDAGKYDEADALEEQAQDLISQEHHLEARAKAIALNPGIPEPEVSTLEDVQ